jgi:hypothetical protein
MFVHIDIAQDGTVIIVAGGVLLHEAIDRFGDVYSFDVSKSVWTRLPDAPQLIGTSTCAVWSNQFIYWGGAGYTVTNDPGPAILNLTSNTWGTTFEPHWVPPTPPTPPTPSSADRAHLSLSNIGLAMVTMISIAVSTLML